MFSRQNWQQKWILRSRPVKRKAKRQYGSPQSCTPRKGTCMHLKCHYTCKLHSIVLYTAGQKWSCHTKVKGYWLYVDNRYTSQVLFNYLHENNSSMWNCLKESHQAPESPQMPGLQWYRYQCKDCPERLGLCAVPCFQIYHTQANCWSQWSLFLFVKLETWDISVYDNFLGHFFI